MSKGIDNGKLATVRLAIFYLSPCTRLSEAKPCTL